MSLGQLFDYLTVRRTKSYELYKDMGELDELDFVFMMRNRQMLYQRDTIAAQLVIMNAIKV